MKQQNKSLSVVVPAYNAAQWLPKSVPKIDKALRVANIKTAEILIVDDGSTDNTAEVAAGLSLNYPIKVISQPNGGRFVARETGAKAARYNLLLFVDTRVYIGEKSLKYVFERMANDPSRVVWSAHVYLAKDGNIYARFWDALVCIAWRQYFSNPRDLSYGIKDFDRYPKGTTCFFVPKSIIQEANNWFKKNTNDLKNGNDDTLLIRRIAEQHSINISPDYNCTYHARTNLKQYLKHVRHRGKVFVDGFLRRDGNRFFWPLVGFLVLSIAVPIILILQPMYLIPALIVAGLLWIGELFATLLLGISLKDAWSLFILSPVFAVFYGLGIWTAALKLIVSQR